MPVPTPMDDTLPVPPPDPALPAPAEPVAGLPDYAPGPGYRLRHDGWTLPRRRRFLHALCLTGCVRDACRIAGISSTSAYRMRRRDARFAAAWAAAIAEAQPALEAAAWTRAVEGVEEPIVHGGKVVATRRRYSDALLRLLIERGDMKSRIGIHPDYLTAEEMRAGWYFDGWGKKVQGATVEEAYETIKRKLDEMHERLAPGEDAE